MAIDPPNRNRSFTSVCNTQHASPEFLYIWDPTALTTGGTNTQMTGAWVPAQPSTFAANINVSGLNLTVGAVAVTGGAINPIAISGVVTTVGGSSNGTVAVTGNPGFTIVNPISVTGLTVTTTSGPIAVTGGSIVAVINNPIAVTGLTVSTTSGPLAVTGNVSTVDTVGNSLLSGISGLLGSNLTGPAWVTGTVGITNPIAITGTSTIQPVTKTVTSNSTPSGSFPWNSMTSSITGQILPSNPNRVYFFIQNVHTGQSLYVNLGTQAASTNSFSFILNPSTVVGWGGATFSDDHYRGPVCVSGGSWNAWEM